MVEAAFWQARYDSGILPWDLGTVAPPFKHLLETENLPTGTMLVVGCGVGHDAAFFGQQGFDVIGIDITQEAVDLATEKYGHYATFQKDDLFNLPESYLNRFDYVLEHTCYCAIDPKQRAAYVTAAASTLKPQGKIIGLFWVHDEWGGPPYATSKEDLTQHFSPAFNLDSLTKTPHSTESRQNEELLGLFTKKRV